MCHGFQVQANGLNVPVINEIGAGFEYVPGFLNELMQGFATLSGFQPLASVASVPFRPDRFRQRCQRFRLYR